MTENEGLNPRKLTFSQAQGYEPFTGPLALEQINEEARIKLWDLLAFTACSRFRTGLWFWKSGNHQWISIFRMLHSEFLVKPLDEFSADANGQLVLYRHLILDSLSFNRVFDLFQLIMRDPNCPTFFPSAVAAVFEKSRLAYVVDVENPVTILPAVTHQEGEALIESIRELRQAGLHGAETHLKKAGESVIEGDWPGAVRESIHAVESVARQLAPRSSKSLKLALDSLENRGRIHPALREAIDKLYGYTSGEEGIRHPLIEATESPVGRDEAVFMLGACASFSSYLWRKYQATS